MFHPTPNNVKAFCTLSEMKGLISTFYIYVVMQFIQFITSHSFIHIILMSTRRNNKLIIYIINS